MSNESKPFTKVLLLHNNLIYRYELPDEYITSDGGQKVLPRGELFRFYSAGYIYRTCGYSWEECEYVPDSIIIPLLQSLCLSRG